MDSRNENLPTDEEMHRMKVDLLRILATLALFLPCSLAAAGDMKYTLQQPGCCSSCNQASECDNCDDCCCCGPSVYASLNLRGSFDNLQSGGFNTVGQFPNTGSDSGSSFSLGGAIGVNIPQNFGAIRLECEGLYVDPLNSTTNSFQPPTPTFFYQTSYSNRWAVLANLWVDIPVNECWDFYAGGGIGGGGSTMTVDDTVVQGTGSSTDVVWQIGCGLTRHYDRFSLDVGYRYMDWGTSSVDLVFGGGPAGNFTADVTSHQLFAAIRFGSIGSLFGQ